MNLTIDTCSLINLANELFDKKYLITLERLISANEIRLVIPKIIQDEWNHHKESKVFDNRLSSFRTKLKHTRSISKLLKDDKFYRFDDLINEIERLAPEIEKEARKGIVIVDELINSENTIILDTSDNLKITASNWAIEKLPPFGEKNSMKDALIFLTLVEYFEDKTGEVNYFISNNFTDFATKQEKNKFSPHLREYAEKSNLIYFQNIPLFMKEVEGIEIEESEEYISASNLYDREELIKRLKTTEICHQCGGSVNIAWLRSFTVPGLSLHILCPNCKYDIDTLEFWD